MDENKFSRRTFIRNTGITAAGTIATALVGGGCHSDSANVASNTATKPVDTSKILNYNPNMNYRRLGKTNLLISEISLGGHWANRQGGRLWMKAFANDEVPEDVAKNRTEVISRCIDRGINYMDPATVAECSAYGVALKGRRDKMYIMATNNELDPKHPACRNVKTQVENIEDCMRRLQTDYIDIFRPMFNQEGKHEDHDIEVCVEAFEKARKQGKVRWLGMSCHNRAFIQHLIEKYPQYSVVIFPYTAKSKVNFTDVKSVDPKQVFERGTAERAGWWRASEKTFTRNSNISVFQTVQKYDIGVITIKPFGGGSLFRTKPVFGEKNDSTEQDYERARLTLAYILCNPAISATIPGMTTVEEVDNNVRASAELQALLDQKGIRKLREATEQMWANFPRDYQWLREWEWV